MRKSPTFKGNKLIQLLDVSVAEIDDKSPNLLTIGNSKFSIKMLCTDGKIYSTHRKCNVEILPGKRVMKFYKFIFIYLYFIQILYLILYIILYMSTNY